MVPDRELACVGLEYFCFEGDGLWASSDERLIALATKEMEILGLCDPEDVVGGAVVRQEKRSEEHTSELQSLMRISYAVFCLKKKKKKQNKQTQNTRTTSNNIITIKKHRPMNK